MNKSFSKIKLTSFSKGSGCGCKINPQSLKEILDNLSVNKFSALIVGKEFADDAAVYKINEEEALISTADFFTPFVNDAFEFGRIAAANAISDIYAMGGTPILALALLGWPMEKLSAEAAGDVLKGAEEICAEAGIPLAGGHSIDIDVPVFGLTVNGRIKINSIKRNNTAKPGDEIFITKHLGTGILSAAVKKEIINEVDYKNLISTSTALNNIGEALGEKKFINAMTDVTGFGLLGHLLEMCRGSNLSAQVIYSQIPLLPDLHKYTDVYCFPDNTYRNWNSYSADVSGADGPAFITLCDPQTNGGLLISASPGNEGVLQELSGKYKCIMQKIGIFKDRSEKFIEVL